MTNKVASAPRLSMLRDAGRTALAAAAMVAVPTLAHAQDAVAAMGQPGVGFFMAIIIGGLAGWIAGYIMNARHNILINIILGIVGAVVGNWLAQQFNVPIYGFWRNLISATVGAVIIIAIYRAISGRRAY